MQFGKLESDLKEMTRVFAFDGSSSVLLRRVWSAPGGALVRYSWVLCSVGSVTDAVHGLVPLKMTLL